MVRRYSQEQKIVVLTCQNHHDRLRFPSGERTIRPSITEQPRRLPPVSELAKDLLSLLLQDREFRLGSRAYQCNDPPPSGRRIDVRRLKTVDGDDAEEIKAHPFFAEIQWERLHLGTPPFVPNITAGRNVDRYFEDEKDILADFVPSYYSLRDNVDPKATVEENRKMLGPYFERWQAEQRQIEKIEMGLESFTDSMMEQQKRRHGQLWEGAKHHRILEVRNLKLEQGIDPDEAVIAVLGRKPVKVRAKDIALRDKKEGPKVLAVRKAGAFLGYTYRRPKFVFPRAGELQKPVYTRPTIIPVNAPANEA